MGNTYEAVLFQQVVAHFNHHIVFHAKQICDLRRNPLLHKVNVDFLCVDFRIKFQREFGRLEAFLVHGERHNDGAEAASEDVEGLLLLMMSRSMPQEHVSQLRQKDLPRCLCNAGRLNLEVGRS